MKRSITPRKLLQLPAYVYYFFRCFFIFKSPLSIIYHYIRRTSPKSRQVLLSNGLRIHLSDHPHDLITIFVVFVKQDYTKGMSNGVIVDIGANIGVFSLYASQAGAQKIFAFEPSPAAYAILCKNVRDNGLSGIIHPYNLAVLDVDDKKVSIPTSSSPYNQIDLEHMQGNTVTHAQVATISLASILNKNNLADVDVLKMDCEGAEYPILLNADSSLLARIREITMEYHIGPVDKLADHLHANKFDKLVVNRAKSTLWAKRS